MKAKTFLKKVKLENFKCYQNAEIKFKDLSIIVGENNAGKSCLIEGIRLIATAAQQSESRSYVAIPKELKQNASLKGFEIKVNKLKINLISATHFYNDEVAKITAYFEDSLKIEVFITKTVAFAVLFDKNNNNIKSKEKAKIEKFNKIGILPQIGLIRESEKPLSDQTIIEDKDTYLTSLHFRNEILHYKQEYYEDFKKLAEDSWEDLVVEEISYDTRDAYIKFFVKDNQFPSEVGLMGSGLKMWLQIMWFLARTKDYEIIILDEPDVYMHADLQRKLLDIVKERYPQVIIATHSLEIISRVEADCIVSINKKTKEIKYATDSLAVQSIIDSIGGMQNLSLIRLGTARKCLFVEGADLPYLNRFNEIIYHKKLDIPVIQFGGYCKLSNVYGASNLLFSETNNAIKCYAIVDKDYKDQESIEKIIRESQSEHLDLHVWEKKEIENYLINVKVLFNIVSEKHNVDYDLFYKELEKIIDAKKADVIDAYMDYYKQIDKSKEPSTCSKKSQQFVNSMWTDIDNKLSIVKGKEVLSDIRKYVKTNYNITLTDNVIQSAFSANDISQDIKDVLLKLQ